MDAATLSLAFAAGALAALNPCGFAMLPGYLALVARGPASAGAQEAGVLARLMRAVVASAAMTLGFVLVFAAFGLVISPVAASAQQALPYVTAATGVLLVAVGVLMVLGRSVPLPLPHLRRGDGTGMLTSLGYGAVYAVASLTCSVGPFLAVVVTSLRGDAVSEGLVLFAVYAAGMGAVVAVAAVAVALAAGSVVGALRSSGRWLPGVTGALLVLVGAYVAYYGVWEARVLGGADPADPVIDAALGVQRRLSDVVRALVT